VKVCTPYSLLINVQYFVTLNDKTITHMGESGGENNCGE
jgi:hypothetical protein